MRNKKWGFQHCYINGKKKLNNYITFFGPESVTFFPVPPVSLVVLFALLLFSFHCYHRFDQVLKILDFGSYIRPSIRICFNISEDPKDRFSMPPRSSFTVSVKIFLLTAYHVKAPKIVPALIAHP